MGWRRVGAARLLFPSPIFYFYRLLAFQSGADFAARGMQIAGGVPLMVDDYTSSPEFSTFRIGLFGLDKLHHVDRCVQLLEDRLEDMGAQKIAA